MATPFSSSRLRMGLVYVPCNPPRKIYWSATTLPSAPSQFNQDRPSVCELGKKGLDLAARLRQLPERGARQRGRTPCSKRFDGLFFDAHAMPSDWVDIQGQTLVSLGHSKSANTGHWYATSPWSIPSFASLPFSFLAALIR